MGQKLGIIGLGHVGNHVFTQAMNTEMFSDIVVIDVCKELAEGQMYDQVHATGLYGQNNINVIANDYSALSDADVIIISATHVYENGKVPADRQELLKDNVSIFKEITESIMKYTKDAYLIWISNPVDTAVYLCSEVYGYPSEKVIGTGTLLDSSRLKYILAKRYNVSPSSVNAYMLGEHGYTSFACLSHTSIVGIAYEELYKYFPDVATLSLEKITKEVVDAAYIVFNKKAGVTETAIGQVAIRLARAILLDEKAVLPVSSVQSAATYGSNEKLAMSLPSIVGKDGVEKVLNISISEEEKEYMKNTINEIQKSIKLGKEWSSLNIPLDVIKSE